ncbi:hypothetical protein CA3LBN_003626 [Candidozyma haemuli]|uniref:Uncharacterized protein n=1 Tax=Candidozyma haemuli TaxID=45357 RepID=A0ABX8I9Z0_9ASCO|nr:hypothetical protein CA3LBN_003626 [[Candida] haemuloni]
METEHLYFFKKAEDQKEVEDEVASVIKRYPKAYASHEVYAFAGDNTMWMMTDLELRTPDSSSLDEKAIVKEARRKEGISYLGSGPTLNDSNCRLVQCVTERQSLNVDPLEALGDNALNTPIDDRALYELYCLWVGKKRIPFQPGITRKSVFSWHDIRSQPSSTVVVEPQDSKNDHPIEATLMVDYNFDQDVEFSQLSNVVCPGKMITDFNIRLHSKKPAFCGCIRGIVLRRIVVKLKEFTSCKVPVNGTFAVCKDVKDETLRDTKFKFSISPDHFDRTPGEASVVIHSKFHECRLPYLGPSFSSENCSRTYALQYEVSFECTWRICSSRFVALIGIGVPVPESTKAGILGYQTISVSDKKGSVLTTTTISLLDPPAKTEKPFSYLDVKIDPACALVYRKDGYSLCSGSQVKLEKSLWLSLYDSYDFLPKNPNYFVLVVQKEEVVPGMRFEEAFKISIITEEAKPLGISNIDITIVEKTVIMEGQKQSCTERSFPLLKKCLGILFGVSLPWHPSGNKQYEYPLPGEITKCQIPRLAPSLASSTMHRDYFLVVTITPDWMTPFLSKLAAIERIDVVGEETEALEEKLWELL